LKISQQIKTAVSTDENAVFAADEMVRICEENLANPPEETPTPAEGEATAEPETETPAPEATEVTATP
jgi:hypothetical protein